MRRTSLLGWTAALAGGLFLASVAAHVRAESPLPTGPQVGDQDLSPFYRWTEKLPGQAGVMLREEPMKAQPEIADAGLAHRILYTSTDARWHSGIVPVSGTLYLPKGEAPAGGWPLVAWAHGTLGVADSCAPSWAGHKPRDATYINRWLAQGFAVVATDYQGLGGPGPHAYLIWEAEGRSVLDAVRAARHAYPGKLANKVSSLARARDLAPRWARHASRPATRPTCRCWQRSRPVLSRHFPRGRTSRRSLTELVRRITTRS